MSLKLPRLIAGRPARCSSLDVAHLHDDERLEALRLLVRLLRMHAAAVGERADDANREASARFPRLALKSISAVALQRFAATALGGVGASDSSHTAAFAVPTLEMCVLRL